MPPRGGAYVDPAPVLPFLQEWMDQTPGLDRTHPSAARYLRALLRDEFRRPSLWRLDELLCLAGRPDLLEAFYPLEAADG